MADKESGKKSGRGERGSGYEEWWSGADPEKVSRFLLDWQEQMRGRDEVSDREKVSQSMETMMKGWEAWWKRGGVGVGGVGAGGDEGGGDEGGSENEARHTVPPDAVMGFILSLLQRCDRLEERIRVLEEDKRG